MIVQWVDDLQIPDIKRNPVTELFVREDKVFAYTRSGSSYVISRKAGVTEHVDVVPSGANRLHPPVLLKDRIVYATNSALEVYDTSGVYLRSIPTGASIRSDAVGDGRNNVFVSLDTPGSSRVCRYDILLLASQPAPPLGQRYPNQASGPRWALQAYHGDIEGAPAWHADVVYVGGGDGLVMAVSGEDRAPIWPIEEQGTPTAGMFDARGPIVASLAADDSGLYVPTFNGKLYCLNRISGQVKWQYFASGPPLDTPAILMSDTVYLNDPARGVVAIDKVEPPVVAGTPSKPHFTRDARWTSTSITQIMSQDDRYTYARRKDDSVVATR